MGKKRLSKRGKQLLELRYEEEIALLTLNANQCRDFFAKWNNIKEVRMFVLKSYTLMHPHKNIFLLEKVVLGTFAYRKTCQLILEELLVVSDLFNQILQKFLRTYSGLKGKAEKDVTAEYR
jgi:hypothetical protein